jgi:hypothetical protein
LNKKIMLSLVAGFLISFAVPSVFALPPAGRPVGPREPGHSIYVTSQNLYYNTIVPILPPPDGKGLPWNSHNQGSFQLLDTATGQTEFGPGDPGYRGGRWWVDDGDNIQEDPDISDDYYFLCPLLGPGMETP